MNYRFLIFLMVVLQSAGFLEPTAEARTEGPLSAFQEKPKSPADDSSPPKEKDGSGKTDDVAAPKQEDSKPKGANAAPNKEKSGKDKKDNVDDLMSSVPKGDDARSDDLPPPPPTGSEGAIDDPTPPPNAEGVEVQTRGPVHEAFAEPAGGQPIATPVLPKAPPEPIQEQAPNQKPQGQNSVWIPGYWSFDDEKKDNVWVSGVWRVPPPGRVWVPGNWQTVRGGVQWIAGFWSVPKQDHLDYLPAPPAPIDAAAPPAPEPGFDYAPGCWVHRGTRFLWRPGFWHRHFPGWIWVPATYVWTPGGCVYVDGYWDHPLELRGCLFSPVVFDRNVIARGSFRYTPEFVVNAKFLTAALFARPSHCSYYFGDYFGPTYSRSGYVAWCDYRSQGNAPDPLFDYYRVEGGLGRRDAHWAQNVRQQYAGRTNGRIPLPPRTLAGQTQAARNIANRRAATGKQTVVASSATNIAAVTHLSRIARDPSAANNMRLERVSAAHLVEVQKTTTQYRDFARERRQAEARLSASTPNGPAHVGVPSATPPRPRSGPAGIPVVISPGPAAVAARTIPLRVPHEIVRASAARPTAPMKPNAPAVRTMPPQPTIPAPQPHTASGGKP